MKIASKGLEHHPENAIATLDWLADNGWIYFKNGGFHCLKKNGPIDLVMDEDFYTAVFTAAMADVTLVK